MLTIEEIIISLLSMYGGYFLFHRNSPQDKIKEYIDVMLYGIAGACIIILAGEYISFLLPFHSKLMVGFFHAAFVEKCIAFVFLWFHLRFKKNPTILYSINSGIFFGATFACLENMIYAFHADLPVVFIRLFSSVLIHIITCAIIGFFIGLSFYFNSRWHRFNSRLTAFLLPLFFHGFYDTFLLLGRAYTYFIAPILVLLMIIIEYIIARSHIMPTILELEENKITLEDWHVLQRQPQYERWITRSMSSSSKIDIPFIKIKTTRMIWLKIFTIISFACFTIWQKKMILNYLKVSLTYEEYFTLFVLYPVTLSLILIINGSINSEYFKYSRLSIPVFSGVIFMDRPEFKDVLAPDINFFNSFMITFEPLGLYSEIEVSYFYANIRSSALKGRVVWENHEDSNLPLGSIIHFQFLNASFLYFLFRHSIFKLWKGFLFNIRFPGFKEIRNFFVKAVSVMEELEFHKAGDILFNEGEEGYKFYLLKRGRVEIEKTLESGETIKMAEISPGEIFGELAILGAQTRAASAICETDCILAVAHAENLDALIKGNQEFSYKLIETLAKRIKNSERIMSEKLESLEMRSMSYELLKKSLDKSNSNFLNILSLLQGMVAIVDENLKIIHTSTEWQKHFSYSGQNHKELNTFLTKNFGKGKLRGLDIIQELFHRQIIEIPLKPLKKKTMAIIHTQTIVFGNFKYHILTIKLSPQNKPINASSF